MYTDNSNINSDIDLLLKSHLGPHVRFADLLIEDKTLSTDEYNTYKTVEYIPEDTELNDIDFNIIVTDQINHIMTVSDRFDYSQVYQSYNGLVKYRVDYWYCKLQNKLRFKVNIHSLTGIDLDKLVGII